MQADEIVVATEQIMGGPSGPEGQDVVVVVVGDSPLIQFSLAAANTMLR